MQKMTPLIVGAGPVGLGAAFLIRRAGIATRIVDQAVQPAAESKALAVNLRTLELLESSGITQEMLDIGIRVVGMNLGLEDAWVFSRLAQANRLQDYEKLRMPCDRSVVKRVEFFSRMVMNQSSVTRLLRSFFLSSMTKTPFIRNKFLAAVTGLDHQVEIERT